MVMGSGKYSLDQMMNKPGYKRAYERHKKLARITYPMWLYVAVTGVIVYLMISPYYAH
jgi:putative membrane protein